jgi:two-component system, cell cycle sensor histidine kinase and response regulator CckA
VSGRPELPPHDRLAAIIAGSDDAILAKDLAGMITDWNPAAERLYGYSAQEAIGRPVAMLVPPERAGEDQRILERVLEGERVERFETERVRADGSRVRVALTVSPIHDESGATVGASTIARDISERTVIEADRALLASVVNGSGDAIMSVSGAGTILSWNPAAERLFGHTAEQAIGRPIDDMIDAGEQNEQRRARANRVFERGEVIRYDAVRTLATGEQIAIGVTISPIWGPDGTVTAASVMCRDITQQREVAERMRRLAAIVESAHDPIFAARLDGTIVSWNRAAEVAFGTPAAEAIGRSIDDVLPEDALGGRDRLRERIAHGETISEEETSTTLPDGTRRDRATTMFPIRDERGEVIAGAVITRDITEHRRLTEQLSQAQRLEAVGRLAGGVAHDFNNLLTVITGYTSLLARELRDGPNAHALTEVHRAARRAAELTAQLLAFSRQRPVTRTNVDLGVTVREVMPMLARLMGEHIEIVVATREGVVPVLADRGQIEQVILNLALNARDAMPDGGTLTIETQTVGLDETYAREHLGITPGRYACLTITDTGEGMEPEVAKHVFEPFFTTKEVGKGTGLGLASVHGTVTQAGGQVTVYSEPGFGASFKVYLPAAASADPVQAADGRREAPRREAAGRETVLLCEDEEPLRALVERILTREGYTVLAASHPAEALELAAERHGAIDVLVSDVVMPGFSGPELAERLTRKWGGRPLLFLSGYSAETVGDRASLPRGSAFLEKPFDPTALLDALRDLLDASAHEGGRPRSKPRAGST